jgi:PAS domain S-box-containing protein
VKITNIFHREDWISGRCAVPLGIVLAVVYWFVDSAVDSFVLHQGTFSERILPADAGEIILRLVVCLLIILFGIYSHAMIVKTRRMEAHHKREHDFIASVLDTADALVVVLDSKGMVAGINRSFERTMGYRLDEVKGDSFGDRFPVNDDKGQVRQIFSDLRSGRPPGRHEGYWKTKAGGLRMISWSNAVLTGDGGNVEYIIATGIDITERQRLEHERRDMLSMFAHDMRSPVITTGGYLSRLLSGKAGPLGEK